MNLARGLESAADNYTKQADQAATKAREKKQDASWWWGRESALRQAAIDFRTLADLAAETEAKP